MKRFILAATFSLSISFQLCAQIEVPATFLFEDSLSLVTMIVPVVRGSLIDYPVIQKEVVYFDDAGTQATLSPGQLKEVKFNYDGEDIRLISAMYMTSKTHVARAFLKSAVDGAVNVYEFFTPRDVPRSVSPVGLPPYISEYVLQKGKGELKFTAAAGFKKDIAAYFSDCPQLADLIFHKDFKKQDMIDIALYYNSRCQGN